MEVVEEGCQVSVWAHLCSGRQPTVYYSQQAHTSPPDTLTVRQSWDNKVRGAGGGGQGGGPQGVHKVGKGEKKHPPSSTFCFHSSHLLPNKSSNFLPSSCILFCEPPAFGPVVALGSHSELIIRKPQTLSSPGSHLSQHFYCK